jgi:hypothetical protein
MGAAFLWGGGEKVLREGQTPPSCAIGVGWFA